MIRGPLRGRGLLRRAWRRSREIPGVRLVAAVGDSLRWMRTLVRSGEIDTEFVAAQRGRSSVSPLAAARAYAFGGFRRGMTVRPDVDDAYAAARLPEGDRVPAFYSYLRNRAADPVALRDPQTPHVPRQTALRAAREWARGDARWGEIPDASTATLTIVVVAAGGDARLADRLRAAAEVADRVVVAAVGVQLGEWLVIGGTATVVPLAARLFPPGTDLHHAVRSVLPGGGRVVVVDPRVAPHVDELRALVASIRADGVVVPVELAPDDAVAAAGSAAISGRCVPLFAGFPREDVRRLAEPFAVPRRAGLTFAAFAPVPPDAPVWVDPALRVRLDPAAPSTAWEQASISCRGDDRAVVSDLYARAGYEVTDWDGPRPCLRRTATTLRWAIKVASLAGPVGDVWGDSHFGDALADALRRRGHDVVVDRREAALRATTSLDDVHLIVRGPTRLHPPAHGIRILWIISHPHEITAEEVAEFDLVFAASERWAAEATRRFLRPVGFLGECTDATHYRPHGLPRTSDILFVGKSRDVPRRVVMAPVEAGIPVRVYGPDWAAYIPLESVVAPFVPLSALPEMYERAGVVLNDQWAEMREAGFPAMRPFDVVAAGGRVISEYVDGLREALGPGVVTYRHEAELVALLTENDLDRLFPSDDVLRENAERVRREHSFDARAAVLEEAVSRRDPGVA